MIELQQVTIDDSKTLCELAKRTFTEAFAEDNSPEDFQHYLSTSFTEAKIQENIQNQLIEYFFAKKDQQAIAYLQLNYGKAQTHLQDEQAIEIERIYVLQAFQGNGIGKILLDQTIQRAKAQQKQYIWLGVWEKNTAAIRFYERHGFTIFGQHSFQLGTDIQTDFKMKLEL